MDSLEEVGMLEANAADTLLETSVELEPDDGEPLQDQSKYKRIVGKLIYHTVDISFAAGLISQFMQNPRQSHWRAVTRILRYLKKYPTRGVFYRRKGPGNLLQIQAFVDSDWAASVHDRRSTSGYKPGRNMVIWKSKKQNVEARSSVEVEYRAIAKATTKLICIRMWLGELGFKAKIPVLLWCGDRAAINIAKNPVFHERTRQIEVDCHYIRDQVKENVTELRHISTQI